MKLLAPFQTADSRHEAQIRKAKYTLHLSAGAQSVIEILGDKGE